MILIVLFSLLLPWFLGFFSLSLTWPRLLRTGATTVLRCSLAFGFGCGLSSCFFFCWLCLAAQSEPFWTFVVTELIITLTAGLLYAVVLRRDAVAIEHGDGEQTDSRGPAARLLPVAFWIVLSCAAVSFILLSLNDPHGGFDAVAIWNLRARFLARGTVHWRDAFDVSPSLPHPDYPLLLPATVARCWKYIGHEPVLVPISVAFLFTFSSVALLCSALTLFRSKQAGYLGGLVLLSASFFVIEGTWQFADAAVGFFILCSIVALALYDVSPGRQSRGLLILAGASAGLCSWTKNEGLLFVLALLTIRLFFGLRTNGPKACAREMVHLIYGLVPILAVLAYFKLRIAPGNYYLTPGAEYPPGPMRNIMQSYLDSDTLAHKLTDLSRYRLIAKSMISELIRFGYRTVGTPVLLGLYLTFGGWKLRSMRGVQSGAAVLVLMLTGYFFVYLTTPLKLDFHLQTSLLRLLLQLWPTAVFLFIMGTSRAGNVLNAHLSHALQTTYRAAPGFDTLSHEESYVHHESEPGQTA